MSQGAWESLNLGAHCGDNLEELRRTVMPLRGGKLPSTRSGLSRCTVKRC
ncbi:hypothetical protein ACNKHO_16540 [Shigella flexneri]